MAIRILIVDDHPFVRIALQELFESTDDITVVGTCADGSEVVEAAARLQPEIVLMDVEMPRMTGLEATRELLAVQPTMRVVILTGAFKPSYVAEAKSLGVAGLLLKGDDPSDLPDRIRAVAAGGTAWSRGIAA
jgi:DNA-binding NarL/FixJ family response regulator